MFLHLCADVGADCFGNFCFRDAELALGTLFAVYSGVGSLFSVFVGRSQDIVAVSHRPESGGCQFVRLSQILSFVGFELFAH